MSEFKPGDQIARIWFSGGSMLCVGGEISRIEVAMEPGMFSGLPWFEVYDSDGNLSTKWNAAAVEGVEMLDTTGEG